MKLGRYTLPEDRTIIMGVLNVTPDSFSDGGLYEHVDEAVRQAHRMIEEGADIIDIGGESSRPGSEPVSVEEELSRVVPVVERLVKEVDAPLSLDTYKPAVAEACLKLGVHMINDISGLRDDAMLAVIAQYNAPVVIMHMLGKPKTMQEQPIYDDVIDDIVQYLQTQVDRAKAAGIAQIIVDPGVGFGKTLEHNLAIINNMKRFKALGYPVLVGLSRKSFIGKITDLPVTDRLEGTIAAQSIAVYHGADIVRVHDVQACKRAAMIVDALTAQRV